MGGWFAISTAMAAPAPADTVPVTLPAGEDQEVWRNALALAGLRSGPVPAAGPGAELRVEGEEWTGWVRDTRGIVHPLRVPVPAERAQREALAAFVASLVRPVQSAPIIALPPVPEPPRPRPLAARPLPLEVVDVVPPPSPPVIRDELVVEDVVTPAAVVPEEHLVHEPAHAWVAAGTALRMRLSFRTAASASVWAGIAAARGPIGWRVGVGLDATAPAEQIRLDRAMAAVDLKALAAFTSGRWDGGLVGGPSLHLFPDNEPAVVGIPIVGVTVGYVLPLGTLACRLGLGIDADLGPVYFPGERSPIQPLSASLGLAFGRF